MSREFIREDYLRLEIEFSPLLPAREVAIAYLAELQFEVFENTENGLLAYIPISKIDKIALEEVKLQLEGIASKTHWAESIVKSENWNAKWEEQYEAVCIEKRVSIRAPFHKPMEDGLDIIIKPNMSFGTGHHDTTWMMIKALLDLDIKDQRVLDMGCGTGVLAIAAKKLGAQKVLAIDIEEGAIENVRENAHLNSISLNNAFIVDCGTSELLTTRHTQQNQIILANINRNVLISDMPTYDKVLSLSGTIVFSGFFTGDVVQMSNHINKLDWSIDKVLERNGWACIICGKTAK